MKDLFELGLEELRVFRKRASRLYGAGRLSKEDFDEIDERVQELINTVDGMRARDAEGMQGIGGIV